MIDMLDEDYHDADICYRLESLVRPDRRYNGAPRRKEWVAQVPSALLLEAAAVIRQLRTEVTALTSKRRAQR